MANPPGSGYLALFTTNDGTRYGVSSSIRGVHAKVDGIGTVWFRPSGLQAPKISAAISTPLELVNQYGQLTIVCQNADWWIADHLSADRFDGAEVTMYFETGGVIERVLFSGYVLDENGVNANNTSVTFQCTDTLGKHLANATIGGKATLNQDTFPYMVPPQVVAITMQKMNDTVAVEQIARVAFYTSNGFGPIVRDYTGPWPIGPYEVSGISNGTNITFHARAYNVSDTLIYDGSVVATISNNTPINLWISPEDVDAEAPTEVTNPDEGKAIPVILGQYANGIFYVPCYVYDWRRTNGNLVRYVVEDMRDMNGDIMRESLAGNNDVIIIDTNPPQEDADGNPIADAWNYIDDATSIRSGQFWYLRKDGRDRMPGGIITWRAGYGPGNVFNTFDLNAGAIEAWMQSDVFNKPDFKFDPSRFHVLTQAGGCKVNDPDVLDGMSPYGVDAYRVMGLILRLLVEHAGVPADRLDYDAAIELQDLGMPKGRRFVTQSESVADHYAWLCFEAGIISYVKPDGKISWKLSSLAAPPPATLRIDETMITVDGPQLQSKSWGDYYNAANATTEQGLPYQDDEFKITIEERTNAAAITAHGSKVSTTLTFHYIYDRDEMRERTDESLAMMALPSDTIAVVIRGFDPTATASDRDRNAQLSLVAGDTVEGGLIVSKVDSRVRRLLAAGSLLRCIGFEHDPDLLLTVLTLWKFGQTSAAAQSVMLMMEGDEEFPAELGGGPIGETWNEAWSDAQKAHAANYGSGVGGWISDDDEHISTDDTSEYNTSLME